MFQSLPFWTLKDALDLIRGLQPETRKYGYHLCLGGGVLNKGESQKDLDLYFLALGGRNQAKPTELINWLEGIWGFSEPIGGGMYPPDPIYPYKSIFNYSGLRIDVFVVGGERDEVLEAAAIEERDRQLREGGHVLDMEQPPFGESTGREEPVFGNDGTGWRNIVREIPRGPGEYIRWSAGETPTPAATQAQAAPPAFTPEQIAAYARTLAGAPPMRYREVQRELERRDAERRMEEEHRRQQLREIDATMRTAWMTEDELANSAPTFRYRTVQNMPENRVYFTNGADYWTNNPGGNAVLTNVGVPLGETTDQTGGGEGPAAAG